MESYAWLYWTGLSEACLILFVFVPTTLSDLVCICLCIRHMAALNTSVWGLSDFACICICLILLVFVIGSNTSVWRSRLKPVPFWDSECRRGRGIIGHRVVFRTYSIWYLLFGVCHMVWFGLVVYTYLWYYWQSVGVLYLQYMVFGIWCMLYGLVW